MGPLAGIKVLEFEAIGPGPFAGMLLADMGADVLLVDRPGGSDLGLKRERWMDVMLRGRRSVTLDLKAKGAADAALDLVSRADALIEGFRPGVMERLGLGPDACLKRNPKLVYGRMGQAPVPPLNLVGDFGGGGMLLGFGIACALLHAQRTGQGQVVDAAMVEGASLLAAMFSGFLAAGRWSEERGVNALDTGAPWYDSYETKDGKYVAIGAIEAKFFEDLVQRLRLRGLPPQNERARWPEMRETLARTFRTKTRDEWCTVFEGSDACFAPVLSFSEAKRHPQNVARKSFVNVANLEQPAPAPRFSATPAAVPRVPPERGAGGRAALADWGFTGDDLSKLRAAGLGFTD